MRTDNNGYFRAAAVPHLPSGAVLTPLDKEGVSQVASVRKRRKYRVVSAHCMPYAELGIWTMFCHQHIRALGYYAREEEGELEVTYS